MTRKTSERAAVSYDELLMSQMIQLDAVTQLLIEKGVIGEQEFYTKLKQVQAEYQARRAKRAD